MVINSKKRFILNLIYSGISVVLSVGFMQLVLLPLIASRTSSEEYGLMLTIIAIVDVFAVSFGAAICNTRLIKKEVYTNNLLFGDFNVLLLIYAVCSMVLSITFCAIYGLHSILYLCLVGVYSFILIITTYSAVFSRLKRKFYIELISSAIMITGFLLGYLIFVFSGIWYFIFILGYLFSFLFIGIFYGKMYKEPFAITEEFKHTSRSVIELSSSSLLKETVTYSDKLLLYPLMGGTTVAIYHSAAIVGKCVSIVTNPLNGLVLSHISDNQQQNTKLFLISLSIGSICCFVFYWVCLLISSPLLSIIYPQYCEEALKIINIVLISSMVEALVAMINPFIMKLFKARIQIYLNLIALIIYLGFSFLLFHYFGLIGFCYAVVIASCSKLIFLLLIFFFGRKNKRIAIS